MKYFIILLVMIGFAGITHGDTSCDISICVLESSWDGSRYVNPGETYWLKVQIQPNEKLDVKIFYYDDSIVHQKIYDPDEKGNILIEYVSPANEESLSFYRVAMMVDGNPSKVAGEVFRIGDSFPFNPLLIQTNAPLSTVKIGDTIHLESHNNQRWGQPIAPYYQFNVTLLNPSGQTVHQNQITTDERGNYSDTITVTEKGFYKLIFNDDDRNKQVYSFPSNFDTTKTIHAEGKDFEILFGHPTRAGIEFIIHDLVFDQQAKSLTILAENPDERKVRFDVKIPHELLNGNMTTIVDDVIRDDIKQGHILNYSDTLFLLEPGNHTVEIIGTSAIPEFETAALIILTATIVPIILARNKSCRVRK